MSRYKRRVEEKFLEALRKLPIIENACKQAGVSRATIYRWRRQDDQFAKRWDEAIEESRTVLTDLAIAGLISQMKNGSMSAIALVLTRLDPAFRSYRELPLPPEERPRTPIKLYDLKADPDPMPAAVAERLIRDALKEKD